MSILNSTEIANLAADLNNVWKTFSKDRNIVVWKEPIRQPITSQQTDEGVFGFGGADVAQNYEYIPMSGVFPAIVRYASSKDVGKAAVLQDTNTVIPIGHVRIKVSVECHTFIESGKTDKISFDNQDWSFVGKAQRHPFMGTEYYMYQLGPKV